MELADSYCLVKIRHMRKIILITFFSVNLYCCSKKITSKETVMQKFDIKDFENRKVGNELNISENGVLTKRTESDKEYVERREESTSPFVSYTTYYKGIGTIKETFTTYYGFCIGQRIEYDNQGKVINTTNCDKDYSYSVYDLAKKMLAEFNIDILHRKQKFTVVRGYDAGYYYEVSIPLNDNGKSDTRVIRVNGTTGATISVKIEPYTK